MFFTHSLEVQLFHNEGDGTFVEVTEDSGFSDFVGCRNTGATWFDYNNDGFLDIYVAPVFDDHQVYYNDKGEKMVKSASPVFFSDDIRRVYYTSWTDIDNDGDMDVFSASPWDHKIAWYENLDGQGLFGSQQIISLEENFGNTIYASDIDNDSDIDVVGASTAQVGWLENLTPLAINDISKLEFSIYPNPVTDYLYFKNISEYKEASIYDVSGRLIRSVKLSEVERIDVRELQSGAYILRIDKNKSVILIKD